MSRLQASREREGETSLAGLCLTAAACAALFALAAPVYVIFFLRHPLNDWIVYYSASRAYLEDHLTLIFDGDALTAHMNAEFGRWLPEPLTFHPWIYPPPFLVVLIPFGLLPFGAGYAVFLMATFACLLLTLWHTAGEGYRRCLLVLSVLFSAPTAFTIGDGQNAFLSTALLVGGFSLLARYPILAGAFFGLLTYKPQLWLMVPVALVAARQWRALGSATVVATGMALVSVAVLGTEPWRIWIEWTVNPPPEAYQQWLEWGRSGGESVYNNLVALGASHALANLGQGVACLAAGGCVWRSYRCVLAKNRQLVVLLAATMLAAPHVGIYDAVLLVVGATLFFADALDEGRSWVVLVVPVGTWMIQFGNPPDVFRIGLLSPVLTSLLLVLAMARIRANHGRPQPSLLALGDPPLTADGG
jgi:alpha-1,2-mannosyltransferase